MPSCKLVARNSDGIILMNYDEHEETSDPGPVASEPWFEANLTRVLKLVPKEKVICGIGNYGFDWATPLPEKGKKPSNKVVDVDDLTVQDAWQRAADADANVHLEGDELNPHFAYDDEDAHLRHQVWFLDGVTALNELRAGRQMGLRTFALWRLGEEDPSLWQIWDRPSAKDAPEQLRTVPPGANVDTEGEGDILRIVAPPQTGERTIQMDADNFTVIDEDMVRLPHSYMIQQYGYDPHKVALSFDDGPDPVWTPRILDVLKKYHVHATFMVIGEQAQNNIGLLKRYVADGDEIGNHTYTHPDISDIPPFELQEELNWTERLFAAELGVQPLYFRPPVLHRPGAGHQRRGRPRLPHPADGLHHHRRQDRHRRLERAPAQVAPGDHRQRPAADGRYEDPPVDAGQHHPDARRRRQPLGHGGRAAPADHHAPLKGLPVCAGLRPDGEDHRAR